MKVWKSLRKKKAALLSALLALSVSGGALAMPQGGQLFGASDVTVEAGGGTLAALLDGATLTVNGNSVINWNSFNIAANETLNVDLNQHSLLNRVTGGSPTELFGKLIATNGGDGAGLFVVNPSGILVGNGAVLNVPELTLSTLNLTDADLTAFVNNGDARMTYTSAGQNGLLRVEGGLTFEGNQLTLLADRVQIADNVTLTIQTQTPDNGLYVLAASKLKEVDDPDVIGEITAAAANTVELNHATLDTGNRNLRIGGGTVSIQDSEIKSGYRDTEIFAGPFMPFKFRSDDCDPGSTSANQITIKDSTLSGGQYDIFGGKVAIDHTKIDTSYEIFIKALEDPTGHTGPVPATAQNKLTVTNGSELTSGMDIRFRGGAADIQDSTIRSDEIIELVAMKAKDELDEESDGYFVTADPSNRIFVKDSEIAADSAMLVSGGTVVVDGASKLTSEGDIAVVAGSRTDIDDFATLGNMPDGVVQKGDAAVIAGKGKEIFSPFVAVGTDTPGTDAPTVDVPADVAAVAAEGQSAMEDILAGGASVRAQTAALMEALNESGGSAEAKSAYVVGVVQAVRDAGALSVKEQDAIIKTALTTYAPTAEGAEQAQQTADKENDNVALGQTEQAMTEPPALDGAATEEPVTGV